MKKFISVILVVVLLISSNICVFAAYENTSFDDLIENECLASFVGDVLIVLGKTEAEQISSFIYDYFSPFREYVDEKYNGVGNCTDLLDYIDEILRDVDLNSQLKNAYPPSIFGIFGIRNPDFNSVSGLINVVSGFISFSNKQANWADLTKLNCDAFYKDQHHKTLISRSNSTDAEVVCAIRNFLASPSNIMIIKKMIEGRLDLGNFNTILKTFSDTDIENSINDFFRDLPEMFKQLMFEEYIMNNRSYSNISIDAIKMDEIIAIGVAEIITGDSNVRLDSLTAFMIYNRAISNAVTLSIEYPIEISNCYNIPVFLVSLIFNSKTRTQNNDYYYNLDRIDAVSFLSALSKKFSMYGKDCSSTVEVMTNLASNIFKSEGHEYDCNGAHSWVVKTPYLAPTCSSDGHTEEVYCYVCGEIKNPMTIIPGGHNWGEWMVLSYATDSGEVLEGRACRACNIFESRYAEGTGKPWPDDKPVVDFVCDYCEKFSDLEQSSYFGGVVKVLHKMIHILLKVMSVFKTA